MKYQHIQRIYKKPFYVNFKKHFCTDCGIKLKKVVLSKIVNSNSPEAKNYDFHTFDNYMVGNVKFIWTAFQCPNCNRQFTIEEMKDIEKHKNNMDKQRKNTGDGSLS